MKLKTLPYETEATEDAQARFARAVSEVMPYDESGTPGELCQERRHSFDVGWPYRITVSVDDGPTMGPKLQVSIGRVNGRGQFQPMRGGADRFAPLVAGGFLREVAGVREEPFLVLARGTGARVTAYHFFYCYTVLPSAN